MLTVSGARPVSAATVEAIEAVCAAAEKEAGQGPGQGPGQGLGQGIVSIHVSGVPGTTWTRDLDVALVTKWERALRRLESLPVTTVAVAEGDCGGPALDMLLATDYRIAGPGVRLLVTDDGEATWPGTALFRLAQHAGIARVRRAVLFGMPIEAAEALKLGLLDELTDDPSGALAAIADAFGPLAGSELAIRRRLMFDAVTMSFEDALGGHLAACDRALRRASAR